MTLLLTLLTQPVLATAQVANLLIVDGKPQALWSEPFQGSGLHLDQSPMAGWGRSTACWAGYRSVWELSDGQLWFAGTAECHGPGRATAAQVLEGVDSPRIPAEWFTGTLTLPQGELVNYVHGGWASTYERERRIDIQAGRVTNDEVVEIVPSGFALVADAPLITGTLLAPKDLAAVKGEFVEGEEEMWLHYAVPGTPRRLSVRMDPLVQPDPGEVTPAMTTLLQSKGGDAPSKHLDFGPRGQVLWSTQTDGDTVTATYVWFHNERLDLLQLTVAKADAAELEEMARGMGSIRF